MQTSDYEADFRTPNEREVLDTFYSMCGDTQYQVWHAFQLKGTFLTQQIAQEFAETKWKDKGYEKFRLRCGWGSTENLEIEGPDGRWMTSNTFIVGIQVNSHEA